MSLPFFIWRKPDVRTTDLTKKESSGRIYYIGTIDKPIWPYENSPPCGYCFTEKEIQLKQHIN